MFTQEKILCTFAVPTVKRKNSKIERFSTLNEQVITIQSHSRQNSLKRVRHCQLLVSSVTCTNQ